MLLDLHISSNSLHEESVATETSYHFVRCGNLRNKSLSAPPILEIIPFAMSRDGFSSATNRGGSVQYISTTHECITNCGKLFHRRPDRIQTSVLTLRCLYR